MDAQKVVAELTKLYCDAPIKQLPAEKPTEIVCEFDPGEKHPGWSLALAVIDKSAPHFHKRTLKVYRVIKGELTLHVGNDEHVLYEGQQWHVTPGTIHWAQGQAAWVEIYCEPAYCADDHCLVDA